MSVLLFTDAGPIVIDLNVYVDDANEKKVETTASKGIRLACINFIKLCKIGYYDHNLIFNIEKGYMIQSGDPSGTGKGKNPSLFQLLSSVSSQYSQIVQQTLFGSSNPVAVVAANASAPANRSKSKKFSTCCFSDRRGAVALSSMGSVGSFGSQFFITLRHDDVSILEGKHIIIGEVAEGMEVIDKIVETSYLDEKGRPYQDIRLRRVVVLDDPFPDPPGLASIKPASPISVVGTKMFRPANEVAEIRPSWNEDLGAGYENENDEMDNDKERAKLDAEGRAIKLEILGDLPSADMKPPENVLFVCKLNPVTTSDDLKLIFSRFGKVLDCEIIKDNKTGRSLQYGFIEFESPNQCEEAYFKMNGVLIDDCRIKVDFSQSVSKVWKKARR